MIVKNAEFLISAVGSNQWPVDGQPEILLCGRSNVGKSSFINALCNRNKLAYTSSTPGMTRMLNFYSVNNALRFVDAPGYGFQKKAKSGYTEFDKIMTEYFEKRENLKCCVLLVDCRREPNQDDLDMLEFIQHHHLPILVVMTKCDKLSYSQTLQARRALAKALQVPETNLQPFSALKKQGVNEVWGMIEKTLKTA